MKQRHRVVVVDDDPDIRDLLVRVLEQGGLDVASATTGHEAVTLVRDLSPDLVTLDLSLPDMDGTEVCRSIREFSDAYVVMITGRDAEVDRLVGLDVGADDYMVKPFSPREVRARVTALLRRPRLAQPPGQAPAAVQDAGGGLSLDPARQMASWEGENLLLTPAEFALLQVMATSPGTTLEREQLVREVWKGEFVESDFLVDVNIGNVRRKLRRAGSRHSWVSAVGGSGYVFHPA